MGYFKNAAYSFQMQTPSPKNPRNVPSRRFQSNSLIALLLLSTPSASADGTAAWEGKNLDPWPSPVNPAAIVTEGGAEIKWMPVPFKFTAGKSAYHIDFENGNDASEGSKAAPWKHHPWDENAVGQAAAATGVHTYVFKGGVTYRGTLISRESGTAAEPIRLTTDPTWGQGRAIFSAGYGIPGSWEKTPAAQLEALNIPTEASGKIWEVILPGDFTPRALWENPASGVKKRLTLARWPNWQIDDKYDHFRQWFRVEKHSQGFPRVTLSAPKVLKDKDPNAYKGATIWSDHINTSGEFSIVGPFPSPLVRYIPDSGSIVTSSTHPARYPQTKSPFYLENLPRFLDETGEWYFDSSSRKLYLLSETDPNHSSFDAAQHEIAIDLVDAKFVEITGLSLNHNNVPDLNLAFDVQNYNRPHVTALCPLIRLKGNCQNITLSNLDLSNSAGTGIANLITDAKDVVKSITISDSSFTNIDNDGIALARGFAYRNSDSNPKARLTNLKIYRNKMENIGFRCSEMQGGAGIDLNGPEVADIAGNVLQTLAKQGININGGRSMGGMMASAPETPLVRILVRHNQVKDSIWYKTDFGGIEFWQTGPAYVYGNISANAIGFLSHNKYFHKNQAFYFDHGFKAALFNNIGWSDNQPNSEKPIGDYFIHEIRNRWNEVFQNTAYNLRGFQTHSSEHGEQQFYIGNLMLDMADQNFSHWRLAEADSIAYANNLSNNTTKNYYNRWRGDVFQTIDQFRDAIKGNGNMLSSQVGWVSDDPLVESMEKHDFRPVSSSAAIDRGVNVFLPWSLYGNVGEWHFRSQPNAPGTVLSHDLYPQEYSNSQDILRKGSSINNDLHGEGFTAADYSPGILEDWCDGALNFDGKKTMAITNARLTADVVLKGKNKDAVTPGKERRTLVMDTNSFLIETVFKMSAPKPGFIASQMDETAGYALGINAQGQPTLTIKSGGSSETLATKNTADGKWHHLLAEVDRGKNQVVLYLDGEERLRYATQLPKSLTNSGDFKVGENFQGSLDYLRISRGTLADAETTIGELLSWQFNGPTRHDFSGQPVAGERRDVGAIENPTASGQKPITYTPPKPHPPEEKKTNIAEGKAGKFLEGPDRSIKQQGWGSVSIPKNAYPGETITIQVAFATETISKDMRLRIDFHGMINGKRKPGIGQAAPIPVKPGVTSPYSCGFTIPKTPGLSHVIAVIYASPTGGYTDKILSTEATVGVK